MTYRLYSLTFIQARNIKETSVTNSLMQGFSLVEASRGAGALSVPVNRLDVGSIHT